MLFEAIIRKTTSDYKEGSFVQAKDWEEAKNILLKDRGPEWELVSIKEIN